MMIIFKVKHFSYHAHPVVSHQLPQVVDQSQLLWIHLTGSKTERAVSPSVSAAGVRTSQMGGIGRPLTKLLSSFLMVDLPHRALTPSTATARRKFDPGCPLCSLSSFITAPTTSLLLFMRLIPCSKGGEDRMITGADLWALGFQCVTTSHTLFMSILSMLSHLRSNLVYTQ